MENKEVRIIELPRMRVAWTTGFGEGPEILAWNKMMAWLKQHNLLETSPRLFGFNHPNPSAGSPNYGYEVWATVGPDVQPEGEIGIKEFEGGLYAVARHTGSPEFLPGSWQNLLAWVEASSYSPAHHQWLEEHLHLPVVTLSPTQWDFDKMVFDLYLPVK